MLPHPCVYILRAEPKAAMPEPHAGPFPSSVPVSGCMDRDSEKVRYLPYLQQLPWVCHESNINDLYG